MSIDITDIATADDPYAMMAELRQQGPVTRLPSGFVAVTGYDAAMDAMRRSEFISSPIAGLYRDRLPVGAANDEMSHRINFLDPPDHPRVRRLVAKAFTPRRIAALVPWIEHTATSLVAGLANRSTVDLLGEFAHELPSLVISELLGVPPADRDQLTRLSDDVAPLLSPSPTETEISTAVTAAESMHEYLGELIEQRRLEPGEDLLSALIAAEDDDERLSRPELLSLAATLYSAGHRTTRDSFSNGLVRLLMNDAHGYAQVANGAWDVATTVRELLRLDTPTLYVARIAGSDTELSGTPVNAGDPLLVYLAAANRDPSIYTEPNELRPGRPGPPPLSFAHGAHYCLGASLATAEIEVMLNTVARTWPLLRRTDEPLTWHQRGPFRGVDRLDVELG